MLFINSILFSVIMILVIGLSFSLILYHQRLSDINQILRERNQSINYFMESFFRETKNTVSILASMDMIINAESASEEEKSEILRLYKKIMETNSHVAYLYSGYEDGSLLINDYIAPENYDPRIRPWYRSAVENSPETSICEPYQEAATKEWLTSTSKALISPNGKIAGVVSIDYSLSLLNRLLREKHSTYKTSYSYIFKEDGEIIIHHYNDRLKMNMFEDTNALSIEDFTAPCGSLSYQFSSEKKIGCYSRIEDNNWIIVTVVNKSEIIRPVITQVSILMAVVFLISGIWAYSQSRVFGLMIITPLLQLKEQTESIISGMDNSKRKWDYPNNEIGLIAKKTMQLARDELLSQNKKLEEQRMELEKLSHTDQLTSLFNRRQLERILEKEARRLNRCGGSFSVLLLDIDYFKKINDGFGHDAGDSVLKEISELFRNGIRTTDQTGRWGGEEFLIICPETSGDGALLLAEKIRSGVEKKIFSGSLKITISIGVAEMREDWSVGELLKRADENLYKAKNDGRNRVVLR